MFRALIVKRRDADRARRDRFDWTTAVGQHEDLSDDDRRVQHPNGVKY